LRGRAAEGEAITILHDRHVFLTLYAHGSRVCLLDELLHTLAAGIRAQTAQALGVRSLTSTRGKDLKIKLAQYDRGTAAHICCSPRHAINCFLLRLERRMLHWQARLYGRDRLMKPRQYISAVESA